MRKITFLYLFTHILLLSCAPKKRIHQHSDGVFYYGQDNKLVVNHYGVPAEVTIDHGKLIKLNDTNYIVKPVAPITVVNIRRGKKVIRQSYHTITIPAPFPKLFREDSMQPTMSSVMMRESRSMATLIENFNFNCTFTLKSFDLIRISYDNVVTRINNSNSWSKCQLLTQRAQNGDTYIITNVKVLHEQSGNIINARDRVITIVD